MKKFRIKIDLSAFFEDERKLAHILVDPAWENVKSLQKRVEQVFEVENVRFITNEGCFVPPQEAIQVIKTSDVLRAFIPGDGMKKKQKKEQPKNEVSVNGEEKVKKRKRELVSKETGFTSSTPNHAKRSKSLMPLTIAIKNSTVDEITSTSEQLGHKVEKQKQTDTNSTTNLEELETPIIANNNTSSHKRSAALLPERSDENSKKRRRKKKHTNNQSLPENKCMEESEKSVLDIEDNALFKQTSSRTLRSCSSVTSSPLRNESQQKLSQPGHSYLNDTGETVSTTTKNSANEIPAKVIFRCPVADVSYNKPRVFSLKKTVSATTENEKVETTPETEKVETVPETEKVETVPETEKVETVPETEKVETASETDEIKSTNYLEVSRKKTKSPLIIKELVIIPSPMVQKKVNEETSNVNEIVSNQTENSYETTTEQTEQEITTAADDSSVIAIESEYDDSEEEKDKDSSYVPNEDVSEIIDLNASDDESQQCSVASVDNQRRRNALQNMSISEMLPFSIALEALPLADEIIIFKLCRLDGKRSGFIAGKCERINKRTKNIKLLVIDGRKEISGIPNKYNCTLDDSTESDKQYLQIKYDDLLDAKLFSTN